jgi:hypothetical protein
MRSALVARAAENVGWHVTLGERFDTCPDVLYVGKIGGHQIDIRGPVWLRYIEKLDTNGCRVIIDYTDHYCGFEGVMTTFYKQALRYADVLVTPSTTMTGMIRQLWKGDTIEITDPCEIDPQSPRAPGLGPWRALWFGSVTNVRYLTDFLSDQENRESLRQINVVTDNAGAALVRKWLWSVKASVDVPALRLIAWSLKNLREAAEQSDIAIIPSDPNDPRKAGVSENRLITAINLGLVTVATPMPAYLPLSGRFVMMGYGWQAGVQHRNSHDCQSCVLDQEICDRYSANLLTDRWSRLLFAVTSPVLADHRSFRAQDGVTVC